VRALLAVFVVGVFVSSPGYAQSAIAGTVTDTTGAVLPGVTVEARSPALIEQVRRVVTNASGRFLIIDLRPGTYSVSFSLDGFASLVRDGIILETQFTATVDVQLRIGAVEETLTVSGTSPVVDVQSTVRRDVVSQEQLQTLPTGRSPQALATMLPAVVNSGGGGVDVGGSAQMQQGNITAYGGLVADMAFEIDGMNIMSMFGTGSTPGFYQNMGAYEEVSYQVVAGSAESNTGGVKVNMIPKSGGNRFTGELQTYFANESFQGDNTTDELIRRGLTAPPALNKLYDVNGSVGGPIKRDRLWFFESYRVWAYNPYVLNIYNADGSPFVDWNRNQVITSRVTAQLSPRNKLTAMYDRNPRLRYYFVLTPGLTEPTGAPEQQFVNTFTTQAKWTSTLSNRLLVDAGVSINRLNFSLDPQEGIPFDAISKYDLLTTRLWNNSGFGNRLDDNLAYNVLGSMSYVTGSHAIKIGAGTKWGFASVEQAGSQDIQQQYRNGAPSTVLVRNTPFASRAELAQDLHVYVQDSWRIGRLTLNPGLRFESLVGRLPVQSAPAGRWMPDRLFARVDDMPNNKNFAPRFGAAYDVFGDGRTAIKGSLGRYMEQIGQSFASRYNPMVSSTASVAWSDVNGDDIAQGQLGCVYLTPGCELNLAQIPNSFGVRRNRNPDPDLPRAYQMLYNVSVQHELMPRVGVGVAYTRRDFYDIFYTNNLAVPFSAYTLLDIPDPRGNGQTVPVYNLMPAYLGRVNELDTKSDNTRTFNAFDVMLNARFANGATLSGGTSTGRQVSATCQVTDPNSLRFCDEGGYIPMRTQFKLSGILPLPYDVRLSGVFQSVLGNEFIAQYRVDRTVVPTLTQAFVNVRLTEPGEEYYDRINQLDFSISKIFKAGKVQVIPQLDLFNALNAAPVLAANTTWGSSLGNVLSVLNARLLRIGAQMRF
jgi:hypothetical protein